MNEESRVKVDDLLERLQANMHYKHGTQTCQTLFMCWLGVRKLPKTCELLGHKPPTHQTINIRLHRDGYTWLKPCEVESFEKYAGCILT